MTDRRQAGLTLLELMLVVAIICLLAGLALTVGVRSRERAEMTACAFNLRQLGMALSLYAYDHDGYLPQVSYGAGDPQAKWLAATLPYYGGAREIEQCPAWDARAYGRLSYVINASFSHGTALGSVPEPATTIIMAERRAGYTHLDYHWNEGWLALEDSIDGTRHGAVSNYLFADGHTEAMPFNLTLQPINMHDPQHR